jgi:hypothetical protein
VRGVQRLLCALAMIREKGLFSAQNQRKSIA